MEKIKLYNNEVEIYFNEDKHQFTHGDGTKIDSVKSATTKLDKSNPLMWWATKMMGL